MLHGNEAQKARRWFDIIRDNRHISKWKVLDIYLKCVSALEKYTVNQVKILIQPPLPSSFKPI